MLISAFTGKAKAPSTGGSFGGFTAEARARTQTIKSAVAAQRLVYGETKVSGPLVFAATSGANSQYLHLVRALAAHEVQAIGSVFLGETEIPSSALDGAGLVTTGTYANKVRIKKHLGADDQAADSDLVSDVTEWTTAHRLRGTAYLYLRLEYDEDVFPQGIPEPAAVVRGKKVYDPRDAGTRWSPNPALILRDYVTEARGLAAPASGIDDTALAAAANVCEEFVAVTTAADTFTAAPSTDLCTRADSDIRLKTGDRVQVSTTGTLPAGLAAATNYYYVKTSGLIFQLATSYANALAGTVIDVTDAGTGTHTVTWTAQARYEAHGAMALDAPPAAIIEDILTGMAGAMVYTQGTYAAFAAAATSATHAIDATWLRGPVTVRPRTPRRELFNAVRGTFVDPDRFWQPTDFPPLENVLYEIQDSGVTDTVTATAATDLLTLGGAGGWPATGGRVVLETTGTLPAPLALLTGYFMIRVSATTLKLASSIDDALAGTAIDITAAGTGVHTIRLAAPLPRSIELPFTTDVVRAQRLASIHLEQSRQGITVDLPCNLKALPVAVWDVAAVTLSHFGWTSKDFRVIEWRLAEGFGVDLVLREESSAAYDWTAGQATLRDPAPDTDLAPALTAQPPTSLALTSGTAVLFVKDDGTVVSRINAAWTDPADAFAREIEVQVKTSAGSSWEPAGTAAIGLQQAFVWDVEDGVAYDVRVRSRNAIGVRSAWVTATNHTVVGKTAAPAAVTGFSVQQNGVVATFKWSQVADADLAGYEIRFDPLGLFDWASAAPVSKVTRGTLVTNAALPPGAWTVGIKAVDTSGNESAAATTADITISNPNVVVVAREEADRWPGVCTGLYRHGVSRRLVPVGTVLASAMTDAELWDSMIDSPTTDAYYEASEIDLGFDADGVRVWAEIGAALGPGETGAPVATLQIDVRDEAGAYDGFEPWPTAGTKDFRRLKARAVVDTAQGGAYLYAFAPTVDVPTRTETGEDLTVAIGGTAVVFATRFHGAPAVVATADGGSALFPVKSAVTATGFTVTVYDAAGADVGGTVDWMATGA